MEIIVRSKYKDKSGERVYFPKDGKPYFDQAFRRTFTSDKEKADFMNKHNIVDAGDSDIDLKRQKKEHEQQKKEK